MSTEANPTSPRSGARSADGQVMRYVCVHGHFYQPPRENPWLEEIELQDSAYPYHDWNERITDECYAANAASRILDDAGLICKITSNYARISFDFGPTLLSWLEEHRPEVLGAVVEADEESRERFSGHGSAMAQTYNHMIQPLASPRDRRTQVAWGVRDFEYRFGRSPEGMWLPETAVDADSLEALAEHGIRFTVLAPHQAAAVRPMGSEEWQPIDESNPLDIGMPYAVPLPSGRTIAVFFYQGPLSRAVAFEGLLRSGKDLAQELLAPPPGAAATPRLMHIATDGETYGHHHRFGDMALAYALQAVQDEEAARLTNYADFLDRFPPSHEATIVENTSWSCAHGIERWRSDCGCGVGSREGWNQTWRGPLRAALDELREQLASLFEHRANDYLSDPWAARDAYIEVILDRSDASVNAFLEQHAQRALDAEDQVRVLELLEMQRHGMLMYTSCGWFFDDLAGIETIQVLRYADRAIQLAERHGEGDIEAAFVAQLGRAHSNRSEEGNGAQIYDRHVRPTRADLRKVGAHFAISSLFNGYGEEADVFCYRVEQTDYRRLGSGRAHLATGRCRIRSTITREAEDQAFAVVHLGDHNLAAGVRTSPAEGTFDAAVADLADAFGAGDLPTCMRLLEAHFGPTLYSLPSLFRDQRHEVLSAIVDAAVADVEASTRHLYDHHAPLLQLLGSRDHPLGRALRLSAEVTLNADLRRALAPPTPDVDRVAQILDESSSWDIALDRPAITFGMESAAATVAERLVDCPDERRCMALLLQLVGLSRARGFELNLWRAQNAFYRFAESRLAEHQRAAAEGDADARRWLEHATALGEALRVRLG